jgi:hypothetical protein
MKKIELLFTKTCDCGKNRSGLGLGQLSLVLVMVNLGRDPQKACQLMVVFEPGDN